MAFQADHYQRLSKLWQDIQDMPANSVDVGTECLLTGLCEITQADRAQWDMVGALPNGNAVAMASGHWIGPLNPKDITSLTGPEILCFSQVSNDLRIYFTLTRRFGAEPFSPEQEHILELALAGLRRWLRWTALSYGPVTDSGALPTHQRKILLMLITGLSEKQIAAELGLSENTTHQYVTSVFRRFGVRSRPSLVSRWLTAL